MEKLADTQFPIHELLRRRWSPRAFADRPVELEKLRSLLEAARWAPSSNNEQPWFFLVAERSNSEEFNRMLGCLVEGNVVWAQYVPVLMLSAAKLAFAQSGKLNRHAFHDVGQAVAHLSVQATAMGLFVHQMAGILPEKAREVYGIPEGFEVVAGIALGYPGDPDRLTQNLKEREFAPRRRKPAESFVFVGQWGEVFPRLKR